MPETQTIHAVLQMLNKWAEAANIEWGNYKAGIVDLPKDLSIQDIARVSLYGTSIAEIQSLCKSIDPADPQKSFAPLLILSELVPCGNSRQIKEVVDNLQPGILRDLVTHGHPQCKAFASKLFLRGWGHLPSIPVLNVFPILHTYQEEIQVEVLKVFSKTALLYPERLLDFSLASQFCSNDLDLWRVALYFLKESLCPETKDGAALMLMWFIQDHVRQFKYQYVSESLASVLEHLQVTETLTVQLMLLFGMSEVATNEEALGICFAVNGVTVLGSTLQGMEKHEALLKEIHFLRSVCITTPLELILKLSLRFVSQDFARTEIRQSVIPGIILGIAGTLLFKEKDKQMNLSGRYLSPLFSFLRLA